MGRNKKWSDGTRAQFIAQLQGGKTVEQAAVAVGVSLPTARKWAVIHNKATTPNPTSAPVSSPPKPGATSPGLERGKVPAPKPGMGGAAAGSGAGGAEAAARAARLEGGQFNIELKPPPGQDAPPPQDDKLPPIDAGKALVFMTQMAVNMTTRGYCVRFKVPFDDRAKEIARLSPGEIRDLEEWAPFAAPLMGELLVKYGKYVGAAIYVWMVYGALADRVAWVKDKAPKDVDPKDVKIRNADDDDPNRVRIDAPGGPRETRRGPMPSDKEQLKSLWDQINNGQMPRAAM